MRALGDSGLRPPGSCHESKLAAAAAVQPQPHQFDSLRYFQQMDYLPFRSASLAAAAGHVSTPATAPIFPHTPPGMPFSRNQLQESISNHIAAFQAAAAVQAAAAGANSGSFAAAAVAAAAAGNGQASPRSPNEPTSPSIPKHPFGPGGSKVLVHRPETMMEDPDDGSKYMSSP